MKIFSSYADYYDIIYARKNYFKEVIYLKKLLRKFSRVPVKKILSMGCGTCGHEVILAKQGYAVSGVDKSKRMISLAKERVKKVKPKINLYCRDINTIKLNKKFDATVSLFNVIGYQTSKKSIELFMENCGRHTKSGGVVIFDAWYKPAVKISRPKNKVATFKDAMGNTVMRETIPKLNLKKSILEINFLMTIQSKTKIVKKFKEKHLMRLFTLAELKKLANKHSMELIHTSQPFEISKPANNKSWDMWVVLRKI